MTQLMRPPSWQCPPQDDCGCGDQWGNIQQCWNEIEQLKLFLADIMSSMGPVSLTGVTDGSEAGSGQVGEFISSTGLGYVTTTVQTGTGNTMTLGTVSFTPGDWEIFADFYFGEGQGLSNASYWLLLCQSSVPLSEIDNLATSPNWAWQGGPLISAVGTVGPMRFLTSVTAGADLRIQAWSDAVGTFNIHWTISARRVR